MSDQGDKYLLEFVHLFPNGLGPPISAEISLEVHFAVVRVLGNGHHFDTQGTALCQYSLQGPDSEFVGVHVVPGLHWFDWCPVVIVVVYDTEQQYRWSLDCHP